MKKSTFLGFGLSLAVLNYGCTSEEAVPKVDCNENSITIAITTQTNTECNLQNGRIEIAATGGSGNYTYKIGTRSFQTSPVFENLSAGNYFITAKDEACETTKEVSITNIDGINIAVSTTASGCSSNLGQIEVAASNGDAPYLFRLDAGAFQEENIFSDLAQGEYTIEAKDASGCTVSQSVRISSGTSFSGNVSSIIQTNCAISNCHNGTQFPDFREFDNIQENATEIKSQVVSGNMPKDGSLSQDQIDAIVCWVDDGAPGN